MENPTKSELKATLENADLPIGKDIEARLGRDPIAASQVASETASQEEE